MLIDSIKNINSFVFFFFHFDTGVLWLSNKTIDGGATVLNRLQEIGKRVFFVTNNATKSRDTYVKLAHERGYNITKEQIITPILATISYLKSINFDKKIYTIGRSVVPELKQYNIYCVDETDDDLINTHYSNITKDSLNLDPNVGAVLINYNPNFHYTHMLKATNYLRDPNCLFLATCMDDRIPHHDNDIIIPGISPAARAIEACSYRKINNLGKPNPSICKSLLNDGITKPSRTLMIGDNATTDILLGKNCGFQTLLVGSGIHGLNDIERWQNSENDDDKRFIPDTYINKLGDLMTFLQ